MEQQNNSHYWSFNEPEQTPVKDEVQKLQKKSLFDHPPIKRQKRNSGFIDY